MKSFFSIIGICYSLLVYKLMLNQERHLTVVYLQYYSTLFFHSKGSRAAAAKTTPKTGSKEEKKSGKAEPKKEPKVSLVYLL